MQSIIKYSSLAFAIALLSTGVAESTVTVSQAHAATIESQAQDTASKQSSKTPSLVTEDQAASTISNFLQTASSQQIQAIQENIKASAQEEVDGSTTTVSIDDLSMERVAMKVISPTTLIVSNRSKGGVNKIKWHGNATKGNVDIYLSANSLNMAKQQGFNILAQICLLPLGAIGGLTGSLIRFALKNALGHIFTGVQAPFKKGRIFYFRGGNYKSWSYQ
ncbi:hypothetical protein [Secundilactobacillus folii]|uniref:Uncharacterized protein n=1 Tax=Secundilactobacillus folii TaxID=2678357 RepID=A0A7X3C2E3_9LACO|nr:hypothetical protein [Secundilactobacillus folii]MTV81392.1 hypothetical protein [Secundilactobacillus folii]